MEQNKGEIKGVITVTIRDEKGEVIYEYLEPVVLEGKKIQNHMWIKKGIWRISNLLSEKE